MNYHPTAPHTRRAAGRGAVGGWPDEGYATIATAGIIAAIASILLVVVGVSAQVITRHQAQVAADMAAVAGAYSLALGDDACAQAKKVAGLNGAGLEGCRIVRRDVIATVTVRGRAATAKAGPV